MVIGILLPVILMAGIDLLLLVKLVVNILVARWDQEEPEDDVGYLGSSTFGAQKIVKMPLCRQAAQHEEASPSFNNRGAMRQDNNADVQQNSESSTGSSKMVLAVPLKHIVLVEAKSKRESGEVDNPQSNDEKSESTLVSLEHQKQENGSSVDLSMKVSKSFDSCGREMPHLEQCMELVQNAEEKETFKNLEEQTIPIQTCVSRKASVIVTNLVPILESPICQEEAKITVESEELKIRAKDMSSHDIQTVSSTSVNSHSFPLALASKASSQKESVDDSSTHNEIEQSSFSRSMSSQRKNRISSFKAVFSSITIIKNLPLKAKKVGFLGEVSGDRTQSDKDRHRRRWTGLFSYSESGAASKSSNTKNYNSRYTSYKSIDSTRSSHRLPEDHEFTQDTTSCTIATVVMGWLMALLILPATFRHAVRIFGSSVSSKPSVDEIEMAILLENLVKCAAVYKFFLCAVAMSSFRQGFMWLLTHWVPQKVMRVSNICCRGQEENDIASVV